MKPTADKWFAKRILEIVSPFLVILTFCLLLFPSQALSVQTEADNSDNIQLELFGTVFNSHSIGVSDVVIEVFSGRDQPENSDKTNQDPSSNQFFTANDGSYQARLWLRKDLLVNEAVLKLAVYKPGKRLRPLLQYFATG